MKHIFLAASLCLGLPGVAQADQASFIEAFNICFDNLMTIPGIRQDFAAAGWAEYPGMSPEEFEYDRNGTHVFLRDTAVDDTPGCTVMDETASLQLAHKLLITSLESSALKYTDGTGYNGDKAWRVLTDLGMVVFTIDRDMGGAGAAVSYELHR